MINLNHNQMWSTLQCPTNFGYTTPITYYPSIHFLNLLIQLRITGCWSISQHTWVKRESTPWTFHQSFTRLTNSHSHSRYRPFRVSCSNNLHVIGLWKESRVPGGTLCRHKYKPMAFWSPCFPVISVDIVAS